jgi:ABC-2 type transport system permease protein
MNGTTKHKDGNGPQQTDLRHFDLRRLIALVTKESYQALRDPSTLLIAFVLPVVLLLLFAYAVSLDAKDVRVGVVLESPGARRRSLRRPLPAPASWMPTSPMTGAKWPTSWSQATCAATW